jgi:hypothetical protein
MDTDTNNSIFVNNDARKVFRKKGACSHTFTYLLNREFGYPNEAAERAADPLAGGIMAKGYQCGMLWGSSLAVGAECYRRFDNQEKAISVAIRATQQIMKSYLSKEKSVDCRDVAKCEWGNKWSMTKYFISGRFLHCFKLAEKWAPEAIEVASKGMSDGEEEVKEESLSCASEVAKKMGATDEEMVMVAGFAGGLGLSGKGCGALSAAIWMNTLAFYREYDGKPVFITERAKKTLEAFEYATDSEMLCHNICGQRFKTIVDHTEYIKNGGCENLINVLAES